MPFAKRVVSLSLLLTGEYDSNMYSSQRALAGLVDSRLEVLAHTGHNSIFDRPDLVLAHAGPFLWP
jgi:pimeloyl-ACP methyl ester carboxylesterase